MGDDTAATASPLPIGATQVRTNYPIGDLDYAAVNLSAGVTYEFFANRLSPQSDTYIYLYDTDGFTQLGFNDDYNFTGMGYSSRIQYTAPVDGTYFVRVNPLSTLGVGTYTMGARIFSDGDGDTYSPYYDCDDTDPAINPTVAEIPGDGIDQNCTGTDGLATVPDAFEPDNVFGQAHPLRLDVAHVYETMYQSITFSFNARTLDVAGDVDYFSFTLPPFAKYQLESKINTAGTLLLTWYEPDGVTPISNISTSSPFITFTNPTPVPATRYLRVESSTGTGVGRYVFYMSSYGTDMDGDGRYTIEWAGSQDCNDNDPAIYTNAPETVADGIDSNCNGLDDT